MCKRTLWFLVCCTRRLSLHRTPSRSRALNPLPTPHASPLMPVPAPPAPDHPGSLHHHHPKLSRSMSAMWPAMTAASASALASLSASASWTSAGVLAA